MLRAIVYIGGPAGIAGLLVSVLMTFLDWRQNPGGIFRGAAGTDWAIVVQTAWSWFWPMAVLFAALAAPVVIFWLRRKKAA